MAKKAPTSKELRTQTQTDLAAQVEALRRDMWDRRQKTQDGSLQQTHHARILRRQIARIKTIQREQQQPVAPAQGVK